MWDTARLKVTARHPWTRGRAPAPPGGCLFFLKEAHLKTDSGDTGYRTGYMYMYKTQSDYSIPHWTGLRKFFPVLGAGLPKGAARRTAGCFSFHEKESERSQQRSSHSAKSIQRHKNSGT